MSLNSEQPMALSSQPLPPRSESNLPRGECRFILTDNGIQKRCNCEGFYLEENAAGSGSQCGCGHQAWHHVPRSVSMEEHAAVLEELHQLRSQQEGINMLWMKTQQAWTKSQENVANSMMWLKSHMDDKIEAIVDRTQGCHMDVKNIQKKVELMDDNIIDLELKVEKLEKHDELASESPVSVVEPVISASVAALPIRTEKKGSHSWKVLVNIVPKRSQEFAFEYNSIAHKRCWSRNLIKSVSFPDGTAGTFKNMVDNSFESIFKGRPWMPLVAFRPKEGSHAFQMMFRELPSKKISSDDWDFDFIDKFCIGHDKMLGDVLYIALQFDDLSWNEIENFPRAAGADDSCWMPVEELDGKRCKNHGSRIDSMCDYTDPPPYTSRTCSDMDWERLQISQDQKSPLPAVAGSSPPTSSSHSQLTTPHFLHHILSRPLSPTGSTYSGPTSHLDVLASAATSRNNSYNSSINARSSDHTSVYSTPTTRSAEALDITADGHRDKIPRLRNKRSANFMAAGHSQPSAGPGKIFVSGRSKRKMPIQDGSRPGKTREAVKFGVPTLPSFKLLHRGHEGGG